MLVRQLGCPLSKRFLEPQFYIIETTLRLVIVLARRGSLASVKEFIEVYSKH